MRSVTSKYVSFLRLRAQLADFSDGNKTHYAGAVWTIVNNYGHIDVLDEINGQDGNRLSNGLTLTSAVRDEFEQLCLWFEAVPVSKKLQKYPFFDVLLCSLSNLFFPTRTERRTHI
jgi:hypothetical protein